MQGLGLDALDFFLKPEGLNLSRKVPEHGRLRCIHFKHAHPETWLGLSFLG
jgi:hypothetical protein